MSTETPHIKEEIISISPTADKGIIIPDAVLCGMIKNAIAPMKRWQESLRNFPGQTDASKFLGLVNSVQCEIAHRVKSHDTILGTCLQTLIALIARKNSVSFEFTGTDKPNGQVTDILLIIQEVPHYVFVQSQAITKNGDGNSAIKNKMRRMKVSQGIIAIVNGESLREKKGNILRLRGGALFQFLTSTDTEITNGDTTLYNRIMKGLDRFGATFR